MKRTLVKRMKSALCIFLSCIMVLGMLPGKGTETVYAADSALAVNVDLTKKYQEIKGFGGMNHPIWISDLTAAQRETVFGNDDGQLGFQILRIHVDENKNQWYRELETAKAAIANGALVFATPWNPPSELTETFNKNGDANAKRLRHDKYAEYAKHLNDFVKYMKNNGVDLYAISIANEPDYGHDWTWWTSDELVTFLKNYADDIDCRIIAPESFSYLKSISDPIINDSSAFANVDIVGTHLYGTPYDNFKYPLFKQKGAGKELWMTEVYYPNSDTDSADLWPEALGVSTHIHNAMMNDMQTYVWWYIRRSYSPLKEDGTISKRGYCMAQYSKFIRRGYKRVEATENPDSGIYVSAYTGDGKAVIVAVNQSSTGMSQSFNVSGGNILNVDRYRTSQSENLAKTTNLELSGNGFWAHLPANSVSTFVCTLDTADSGNNNENNGTVNSEHSFAANGTTSSFFNITGNTSDSKGSVSYNGKTYSTCLKMESGTSISFSATSSGTLKLVFGGSTSAVGKSVIVNGITYTCDSNGIATVPVSAGKVTVTKGDSINLFYMCYLTNSSMDNDSNYTDLNLSGNTAGTYDKTSDTLTLNDVNQVRLSLPAELKACQSLKVCIKVEDTGKTGFRVFTTANGIDNTSIDIFKSEEFELSTQYEFTLTTNQNCQYILIKGPNSWTNIGNIKINSIGVEYQELTNEHNYTSSVTKQATCSENGVKTYTCLCGNSYTESILATGVHSYEENWTIDKAPTTTTTGSKSRHCSSCDAKTDVTVIPKLIDTSSYTNIQLSGENDTLIIKDTLQVAIQLPKPLVKGQTLTVVMSAEDRGETGFRCYAMDEGANSVSDIFQSSSTDINNEFVFTLTATSDSEAILIKGPDYQTNIGDLVINYIKVLYSEEPGEILNGLNKVDGVWKYYENGNVVTGYTGFADNETGTWYVVNGVVNLKATGLYKVNGTWYYLRGNKLQSAYTGLSTNASGVWYVQNGMVTMNATGLYKISGIWYYLSGSKVQSDYTGIVSNASGKWYVENGVVSLKYNGTVTIGTVTYTISGSKVVGEEDTAELKKINGTWYYMTNGIIAIDYTGLADNSSGTWYVKNGVVSLKAPGLYKINGTWYYLSGSKVQSGYTGFASNSAGKWYVENGVVSLKYNGNVTIDGKTYKVVNSKIQ